MSRLTGALGVVVGLSVGGCDVDRQTNPDSGPRVDAGPVLGGDGPGRDAPPMIQPDAGPVLTVEGMVAAACAGGTCKASDVIKYWKDSWDLYAVKRTVRFKENSMSDYTLEVTDDSGAAADLSFEVGLPVSLILLNPGDSGSSQKHNLTAPELYRAVAWRKVDSASTEFKAPHFDAIHVRRTSMMDRTVTLFFVPMVAGTYDAYCQTGVPDGDKYADIVAGTEAPDLDDAAGHAGKGMKTQATITGNLGAPFDPQVSPERDSDLDADPRRYAADDVWLTSARDETYRVSPIDFVEYTDEEYRILPADLHLGKNVGTVLRFINPGTNARPHYFTANTFLRESVLRKAQDAICEVEASHLKAVEAKVGGWFELFLVPASAETYSFHCEIGVKSNADGTPDLTSGHAGKGMTGSVVVTE